jgi:beta-lysine 5,6-aminomutase beta subunit
MALELGFDAGFGPGTKPSEVASFLVEWLCGDRAKAVTTQAP